MNDEDEIAVIKTEFREAYNTGDVERLLAVYADNFADMSEGQPSFYGTEAKTALRWSATNLFRDYTAKMEITIVAIVVLGDSAYDWGWHTLSLTPKSGGESVVERFRYCEIWQKSATGKWQIQIFISNKDHKPEMLPDAASLSEGSGPGVVAAGR